MKASIKLSYSQIGCLLSALHNDMPTREQEELFSILSNARNDTEENDEAEKDYQDDEPHGSYDHSDDAEALASAGHGMDEDYGMIGGDSDLGNEY